VTRWDGPGLDAWRAWRPTEVSARLHGTSAPWCVVGGWAIDLFLGRDSRPHDDIEIAVPRDRFHTIRRLLSDHVFHVVGDGEVRRLEEGETPPLDKHQNWVLDPVELAWRVDVMLEPGDDATWIFRRDEHIRAPRARMVADRDGIPFLRPEGVLLFKAKLHRAKDDHDFEACLPQLDGIEHPVLMLVEWW